MAASFGRFVWYDYMTSDVQGAIEFYTAVVGWTISDWGDGETPYKILNVGEVATGGVMELPASAREMGAPPHWLGYVAVADCDGIAARVTQLGGTVVVPTFDIPTVGRCAVLGDPSHAVFGVIQPLGDMTVPFELTPDAPQGSIGWHELYTDDVDAALAFYGEIFGWVATEAMDIGPMGVYQLYRLPGMDVDMGGIMRKPGDMPVGAFSFYIGVDNIDAAVERVNANGGSIFTGPMEVPGGLRIVNGTDPQGAMFSLLGP